MYITTDEPRRDFKQVTAVEDGTTELQLYDYVLIEGTDRSWIGHITAPNINISTFGGPYDPAILHGIKLSQSQPKVQLAETIESWLITLLGEYENGSLRTLRRRPKPGAKVSRLDRKTTIAVLKLPAYDEQFSNAIGYLLNADDVPLCVNPKIFTHHVMVSGGTGSGKSNTGANLVYQAARQGFTVFLYDAKPDYRKMDEANTDPAVAQIWPDFATYDLFPHGANSLTRVAIFGVGRAGVTNDYSGYDAIIGFRASDFDPYLLAALFFDEKANVDQFEDFASVCFDLKYGSGNAKSIKDFSITDALVEVDRRKQVHIANKTQSTTSGQKSIYPSTADAIDRKVRRSLDKMPWLDKVGEKVSLKGDLDILDNAFGRSRTRTKDVVSFQSRDLIGRGGILIQWQCLQVVRLPIARLDRARRHYPYRLF